MYRNLSNFYTGPDLMNHPSVMVERQKVADNHSYYELERADRAFAKRMKADEENAKRFLKTRKTK